MREALIQPAMVERSRFSRNTTEREPWINMVRRYRFPRGVLLRDQSQLGSELAPFAERRPVADRGHDRTGDQAIAFRDEIRAQNPKQRVGFLVGPTSLHILQPQQGPRADRIEIEQLGRKAQWSSRERMMERGVRMAIRTGNSHQVLRHETSMPNL